MFVVISALTCYKLYTASIVYAFHLQSSNVSAATLVALFRRHPCLLCAGMEMLATWLIVHTIRSLWCVHTLSPATFATLATVPLQVLDVRSPITDAMLSTTDAILPTKRARPSAVVTPQNWQLIVIHLFPGRRPQIVHNCSQLASSTLIFLA